MLKGLVQHRAELERTIKAEEDFKDLLDKPFFWRTLLVWVYEDAGWKTAQY